MLPLLLLLDRAKSECRLPEVKLKLCSDRRSANDDLWLSPPSRRLINSTKIFLMNFFCRRHTPSVSSLDSRATPAAEISRNTARCPLCGGTD